MIRDLRHATRALKHRAYRSFFIAQSFSLVGTWVQIVALSWLVWRLSHSPSALGLTGFVSQIPILLFASFAGVLSDRFNRRRLLMVTQTLSLMQSLILAGLVASDRVESWHCIALACSLGCINAFDTPIRQSFTVTMIEDKSDLPSAIALNSFMFNLARLLGPAVAGWMIAEFSESLCFLFNSLSYVGVLFVLSTLKVRPAPKKPASQHLWADLSQGVRYAAEHPVIRPLLTQIGLMSLLIAPYIPLMSIFAGEVYQGDARTLGLLVSAAGVGATAATVFLATQSNIHRLPTLIFRGSSLAALSLLGFSASSHLVLSAILMVGVGAGLITTAASTNTLVQHAVSDDKRGRVMSLYTMAFLGMAPIGSLILGNLAESIGAAAAFAIASVLSLLFTVFFYLRVPRIAAALSKTH